MAAHDRIDVQVALEAAGPPSLAHEGDAGFDLTAIEAAAIPPGAWARVRTGVRIAIPDGYVGLVCPRSGLAAHHGVTVLNAPGVIDSGYRGEIEVLLVNHHGSIVHTVAAGDAIAQLLLVRLASPTFTTVRELPRSGRGERGFGSTDRR